MTAWQFIIVGLGALWLIGTPAAVFLWERHDVRAEEAARAEEDHFIAWAAELDDTVEFP